MKINSILMIIIDRKSHHARVLKDPILFIVLSDQAYIITAIKRKSIPENAYITNSFVLVEFCVIDAKNNIILIRTIPITRKEEAKNPLFLGSFLVNI